MADKAYKRILLKLSGEALLGALEELMAGEAKAAAPKPAVKEEPKPTDEEPPAKKPGKKGKKK